MKKRILVLIAMLFVVCGSMFAQNSFDKNTFIHPFYKNKPRIPKGTRGFPVVPP